MRLVILLCTCLSLSFSSLLSQDVQDEITYFDTDAHSYHKKNNLFFYWGYNRSYYNETDIQFQGDGYDFTLSDVRATDVPEEWDSKVYLNPLKFTIPQFNFRLGYYFKDNLSVSLGWDHMKYKISPYQLVQINGKISESRSEEYAGTYIDDYILVEPGFIQFEHSDGFNFVRLELAYQKPFFERVKTRVKSDGTQRQTGFQVSFHGAVSIGGALPWTDATIFGTRNKNFLHLAGYGASFHTGLRVDFLNYFFAQIAGQMGYVNMPDIILEGRTAARANHDVSFIERSIVMGAYIPLKFLK